MLVIYEELMWQGQNLSESIPYDSQAATMIGTVIKKKRILSYMTMLFCRT